MRINIQSTLLATFLFMFCFSLLGETLPEPYQSIKLIPYNPGGWYRHAEKFKKIFKKNKIYTVVEVGSFLGKSTRHLASLLPPKGKIYAVDHWLGSEEQLKRDNPNLPNLFHQFLSNTIHEGLADKIVPIRMTSLEAAAALDVQPDLIYIDGDHSFEGVYADLKAWYPFVKGKGILCGDDWGRVKAAVIQFAKDHHLDIENDKAFWQYHE